MSLVNFRIALRSLTQKCKKNLGKIKNRFFSTFLGSAVLAGAVALFFNMAIGFFSFNIFYSVKFGTFFDDLTKSTLLAGGNSKSYGILKF